MLRNYFKVAWRNLRKTPALTLINATGLAVGLGFLFLTAAYIWREYQVNTVIPDNDRVLVLKSNWKRAGMGLEFTTFAPLARSLYENYSDLVENYYHHDGISSIVSHGDQLFSESLQPGDPTFLEMFGFELLYGSAEGALEAPFTLVLTESKARKYFGRADVVGETLEIQSFSGAEQAFEITAVLQDLPYNTVTSYNNGSNEIFLSAASLDFFGRRESFESWQNPYLISYVKLREGVTADRLEEPLRELLRANTPEEVHQNLEIYTAAVRDYYLQLNDGSARRMMLTMGFIALFILFMAVVNFINTTVGNSLTRLKETGLRKVLGGNRQQVTAQFLVEALVFSTLAAVAGILIYTLARPAFSHILGKSLPGLSDMPVLFALFPLLTALAVGLLAGIYPALVLAAQPSVAAMQGKLKAVREKKHLRHFLLALQFTTAIIVFVGAVVVHQQVSYFFNANLGYDKESVLVLRTPRDWSEAGVQKMQTARREFARLPQVSGATFSFEIPDGQSGSISNQLYRAGQDAGEAITATSLVTDAHYLDTYAMELATGDFFDPSGSPANLQALVLNETAARELGWDDPQEAVGEQLMLNQNEAPFTVKGVVRDFHFNTMHENIRPIFFQHVSGALLYRYFSFKIRPGNLAATVTAIQDQWSALFPDAPFDYQFMDETLAGRYQNELQLKKASQAATIIALLIVLLGVIGIILLAITRKTKEIGIRSVLGASRSQIIWLFGREFFWIIVVANLVAWPVAWGLLQQWLTHYAYQVEISMVVFAGTGLLVVGLTAVIVSWLVGRKMRRNPALSLRDE
ncbi:ABC transporter permease [Flavilitoribacter nigricans]|uniref:ABC transporter permease n=1 Tax=Flavilitoribacter nigricans (strain ATCC 23147 / DSM 23189 / NBRC 102662 / NCIMB 1420 / SS-2) TaxID=1122177 RepID=A0A2D0N6K5_FLAN2|nr:ABC transporter permease [Flavilitoribacter nigricans]PHN04125.1 hypothetical protein CRP01_23295 [Flavilitoribacter nigricans DSM 23189 = NBRC 102662]